HPFPTRRSSDLTQRSTTRSSDFKPFSKPHHSASFIPPRLKPRLSVSSSIGLSAKLSLSWGILDGSPEFQRSSQASRSIFTLTASIVTYVGNLEQWLTFCGGYLSRNSPMQLEDMES